MGSLRNAVERIYSRLLSLFPGEFRAEYGEEMADLARERSRRERPLGLLLVLLLDALKTAPREHLILWSSEVRVAFRGLRRRPGFTMVAAGSLAIGLGASAAIFCVADAILLRPLPIDHPERVVSLRSQSEDSPIGVSFQSVSYPDYADLRLRSRSFSGLVAFQTASVALAPQPDSAARLTLGLLVSDNFFSTLGVEPRLGRGFRPDENAVPGRDAVAVLSDGTWRNAFAGDPEIVGKTVRLNGVTFTVVGVTPPKFTSIDPFVRPAVYVPLMMAPMVSGAGGKRMLEARDARSLAVKGRLLPGVSPRQAEAESKAIAVDLARSYPATNHDQSLAVRTELAARIESSPGDARMVTLLVGLVLLVMLIACANVASLLLSRAGTRSAELALRTAIGASPMRVVRQLLTESLLLALLGAVMGAAVAGAGVRLFSHMAPPTDLPIEVTIRLDSRVLACGLVLAAGSVLLFGLIPALRAARSNLVRDLKSGDAGPGADGRIPRLLGRQVLVIVQVALSLTLLVAAASLLGSFRRYLSSDPGFRRAGVYMLSLDPTVLQYPADRVADFYHQLSGRVATLPGVESATLSYGVPFGDRFEFLNLVPQGETLPAGKKALSVLGATVDEHYFSTLLVPIVSGRDFLNQDTERSPRVVIVNQEFERRHWPGGSALGKRIRLADEGAGVEAEVVGVARTHRYLWVGETPREFVYLPFAQSKRQRMTLLVATTGDPASIGPALRSVVRTVDPNVPMLDASTMEDFFAIRAVNLSNTLVEAVSAMGLAGFALALVGLFGLMSSTVTRRLREIGVRMAIGATRHSVSNMVVREGLWLVMAGVLLGVAGGAGVLVLLTGLVEGTRLDDPLLFLLLPLCLVATATLALVQPARRAAAVDPVVTLRQS
ncbi:MAG: ABC transporter permease [Acidobacteriota bacterium]